MLWGRKGSCPADAACSRRALEAAFSHLLLCQWLMLPKAAQVSPAKLCPSEPLRAQALIARKVIEGIGRHRAGERQSARCQVDFNIFYIMKYSWGLERVLQRSRSADSPRDTPRNTQSSSVKPAQWTQAPASPRPILFYPSPGNSTHVCAILYISEMRCIKKSHTQTQNPRQQLEPFTYCVVDLQPS